MNIAKSSFDIADLLILGSLIIFTMVLVIGIIYQ